MVRLPASRLLRPTKDWRLKAWLDEARAPVSIEMPASSTNSAETPPPRSSEPRKPRREADATPLLTFVILPAAPPRSDTMPASATP